MSIAFVPPQGTIFRRIVAVVEHAAKSDEGEQQFSEVGTLQYERLKTA